MARGWESKDIENQQELREEAKRADAAASEALLLDHETQRQLANLQLNRTRVMRDLLNVCHARHRDQLMQSLRYLEAEIQAINDRASKPSSM
jgi:hypothetical protein